MLIDGERCAAADGAWFPSVNPASEELWAEFPDAGAADVDRAVRAADRAFRTGPWPAMSARERGKTLRRVAEAIGPHAEELGRIETTDSGKLLRETTWQARNLMEVYDYYGGLADKVQGDLPPSDPPAPLMMVVREPLGVVGAVVPWNSQLHLAAFKIAPALAAGNTVVLKASEDASAAVVAFARALEDAGLPPGVVNVVTGGAECGQALVSHPLVRRVSFTGGVETARKIIPQTANNIAMMSLELGGKSPVVVFDDADLESAVNGVTAAIFAASGQSCAAGSRLLVQEGIRERFLERLVERTRSIRIGDPMDPETQMGPLATRAQRDRIEQLLAAAIDGGGRILAGGGRPAGLDRGFYFEPTIVAFDRQDAGLVRQELFGPVLSVLGFGTEEEALALAQDTDYAFAGGVFSQDFARAYRVARALPAGRVWVNTYRQTSLMVPFGGARNSGYGREGGIDAVRDYTQTKGIFVNVSGAPVPDPFVMS
jgi:aldehyde dehydrogenase (NAD+)